MEMTFYDDSHFRIGKGDGKSLKRPVTLDLDSPNTASKKQKFTAICLTSPDLNMMATPELERLERLYLANGNLTTTPTPGKLNTLTPGKLNTLTPGKLNTPTQILFPKSVTEEQELYARGFIDALNTLHQSTTSFDINTLYHTNSSSISPSAKMYNGLVPIYLTSPTTSVIKSSRSNVLTTLNPIIRPPSVEDTNSSYKSNVLTTLNPTIRPPSVENTNSSCSNSSSLPVSLEIAIKEEYHTVPSDFSSPPMSPISRTPIDMADQERAKLERKRHRNRIAASKCRKRKLEKISQLEDKVSDLKGENVKLEAFAAKLREQVGNLKQTMIDHVRKGCQIMIQKHL